MRIRRDQRQQGGGAIGRGQRCAAITQSAATCLAIVVTRAPLTWAMIRRERVGMRGGRGSIQLRRIAGMVRKHAEYDEHRQGYDPDRYPNVCRTFGLAQHGWLTRGEVRRFRLRIRSLAIKVSRLFAYVQQVLRDILEMLIQQEAGAAMNHLRH